MEHSVKTLVHLSLVGVDLSITTITAWMLIGTIALFLGLGYAARKATLVPRTLVQVVLEAFIEFVQIQIIDAAGLERKKTWPPLFLSLFLYVLAQNWMGIIPGALPPSGNINATGALAVLMFALAVALRFKKKGGLGFLKSLVPGGVKGPIVLLLFPIELVSFLFKPFSLAVRLFANMSGGHLLLLTLLGFTMLFKNAAVDVVAIGGAAVILGFELFVGLIQAYVFTFLSAIMIGDALADEH